MQDNKGTNSTIPLENSNLDKYGVWIKNKPLNTTSSNSTDDASIMDFSIGNDIDSTFENTSMSFDTSFEDEVSFEKDTTFETSFDDLSFSADADLSVETSSSSSSDFEELDLGDFGFESETVETPKPKAKPAETSSSSASGGDFEVVDFTVDDFLGDQKITEVVEDEPVKMDLEFEAGFEEDTNATSSVVTTEKSSSKEDTDGFEEISFDDFINDFNPSPELPPSTEDSASEESSSSDGGFEEISMDSFFASEEPLTETSQSSKASGSESVEDDDGGLSIDFESNLDDVSTELIKQSDEIDDISMTEEPSSIPTTIEEVQTRKLDNLDISIIQDDNFAVSSPDFEESAMDNFLETSEPEILLDVDVASSESSETTETPDESVFFDDVSAVTEDLMNEKPPTDLYLTQAVDVGESPKSSDGVLVSQDILEKINNEVLALKEEVKSLKAQLNEQASATAMAEPTLEVPNSLEPTALEPAIEVDNSIQSIDESLFDKDFLDSDDEAMGFFADDGNDKITLTEDETANIIADIDPELASVLPEPEDMGLGFETDFTDESSFEEDFSDELGFTGDIDTESDSSIDGLGELETASLDFEEENTGLASVLGGEDGETDEAIALTGDELNNILITADFTDEIPSQPEYEIPEVLDLDSLHTDSPISNDMLPEMQSNEFTARSDFDDVQVEAITTLDDASYLEKEDIMDEIDYNLDENALVSAGKDFDVDNVSADALNDNFSTDELDDLAQEIPAMNLEVSGLDSQAKQEAERVVETVNVPRDRKSVV